MQNLGRPVTGVTENLGVSRDLLCRRGHEYQLSSGNMTYSGSSVEAVIEGQNEFRNLKNVLRNRNGANILTKSRLSSVEHRNEIPDL